MTAVADAPPGSVPGTGGSVPGTGGEATRQDRQRPERRWGAGAPRRAVRAVRDGVARTATRASESAPVMALTAAVLAAVRAVTPAGWGMLGLAALGWSVAARFGWTEGAIAAGVALAAFAIAIGFVLGRDRVTVTTEFPAVRVVAGKTFYGTATGRNTSGRRTAPTRCELPVGADRLPVDLPWLASGATHSVPCIVPTTRRGVIDVGPAVVVRADPLGLLRRETPLGDVRRLYVHPESVPLEPSGAGIIRDLEGMASEQLSSSDLAFHALREYAPGDDLRHVHWRSSARLASLGGAVNLLVRQYVDTRRSRLVVAVSANAAEYASEDAFELGLCFAASLARRAMADGQHVDVLVGPERLDCTAATTMLDGMAQVVVRSARAGVESAVAHAVRAAPDASIAVLVVGEEVPTAALRLFARRFSSDTKLVAIRPVPGSPVGRALVGSLDLLTVGTLSDLRGALRLTGKG